MMASHLPAPGVEPIRRCTVGGRTLWYHLECIQQPERARACGSGPKSSADRRPVDPPPVVQLRIFEGPTFEQAKHNDITFLYNADMFCFATLEQARVIAHGRVQSSVANTPPVLTGAPVSGMAYLDRPEEAGYFIFPDLSVRHEGRYRLIFSLYERFKSPEDATQGNADQGDEYFEMRGIIKTNEFTVFSAKKFPGLTESTTLSRTVAEQGCRVRIRREVRVRRRDRKPGVPGAEDHEEDYSHRAPRETPDPQRDYRARSMSTDNNQRTGAYISEPQRRPSGVEYPRPPPTFTAGGSNGGHLAFGGPNSAHSTSQYPQPYHRDGGASSSSSVPPSPSYAPSQSATFPPPSPYAATQQRPQQNYERPPSQHSHYAPPPQPSPQRETYPYDCTRPSSSSYALPSQSFPSIMEKPAPAFNRPAEPKIILPSVAHLAPPLEADRNLPPPLPGFSAKRSFDDTFRSDDPYGRVQSHKNGSRPSDVVHDAENHSNMIWRSAAGDWKRYEGGLY